MPLLPQPLTLFRNRDGGHSSTAIQRIGLSYVIGQGPGGAREIVESAVLAERSGFDVVLMPEHYYDRDAPSILGAIAQATGRITVGTGIINPFSRFPSLIAMTVKTLDELTMGRVMLGLGSGSVIGAKKDGIPNEFAGQRYDFPLGHLRELVPLIRRLLSGEKVTFEGRFYDLRDVKLNFTPSRRKIPIYFGQQGPKMMRLAGQLADGVLITLCCTVPYVRDMIRLVERSERASNREKGSVDFAARIITSMSSNPRKAFRSSRQLVARVFVNPGARPVMEATGIELDVPALQRALDNGNYERIKELVPDEVVELTTASGTEKQVLNRIEEFRRAGVTLPLLVPIGENYLDIIKSFSKRKVSPR
jgi:5,10-methylenetetrahydromethanopterin reductase